MSILNNAEIALLNAGKARHDTFEMLHKAGNADARLLQRLVGQRCKKFDKVYEITMISYGYAGYIHAHGYRVLVSGKLSHHASHIGAITSASFDDV